jgi:hypothetical protein
MTQRFTFDYANQVLWNKEAQKDALQEKLDRCLDLNEIILKISKASQKPEQQSKRYLLLDFTYTLKKLIEHENMRQFPLQFIYSCPFTDVRSIEIFETIETLKTFIDDVINKYEKYFSIDKDEYLANNSTPKLR